MFEDEKRTSGSRGSPSKQIRSRKKQARRERQLEDNQYGALARSASPIGSTDNEDIEPGLSMNRYYAQQRPNEAQRTFQRDDRDDRVRYTERNKTYDAPPLPPKRGTDTQLLESVNDILFDAARMLFSLLKKPL